MRLFFRVFFILSFFLSIHSECCSSYNMEIGVGLGYQQSKNYIIGREYINECTIATLRQKIETNTFPAYLFLQFNGEIYKNIRLGLRPYYYHNKDIMSFTREDERILDPLCGGYGVGTFHVSLDRKHAFGILFIPTLSLKNFDLYSLLGMEWSRFHARFKQAGAPWVLSKYHTLPALVVGAGVSKDVGIISLFSEFQLKFHKNTNLEETTPLSLPGLYSLDAVQMSPRYVSSLIMGIKYRFTL